MCWQSGFATPGGLSGSSTSYKNSFSLPTFPFCLPLEAVQAQCICIPLESDTFLWLHPPGPSSECPAARLGFGGPTVLVLLCTHQLRASNLLTTTHVFSFKSNSNLCLTHIADLPFVSKVHIFSVSYLATVFRSGCSCVAVLISEGR